MANLDEAARAVLGDLSPLKQISAASPKPVPINVSEHERAASASNLPAGTPRSASSGSQRRENKPIHSPTRRAFQPQMGNVTDNRQALAEANASEIFCCSMEDFIAHYLPFVPSEEQVNQGISALKAHNHLRTPASIYGGSDGAGKKTQAPQYDVAVQDASAIPAQDALAHEHHPLEQDTPSSVDSDDRSQDERFSEPEQLEEPSSGEHGSRDVSPLAGVHGGLAGGMLNTDGVAETEQELLWSDFDPSPSSLEAHEAKVFRPLRGIFKTLSGVQIPGQEANFRLVYRPNNTTRSQIKGSSHKVDCFLRFDEGFGKKRRTHHNPSVAAHADAMENAASPCEDHGSDTDLIGEDKESPRESDDENHDMADYDPDDVITQGDEGEDTENMAVNFELKRHAQKHHVKDNREKAVSGAAHIFHNDPRRMHVFSITIEDDQMALWLWGRSYHMMSQSFNWIQDYRTFVTIALSLIFATPEQMGYDPEVRRIIDSDKHINWVYRIADSPTGEVRYYKTVSTLSELRGLRLTGRSTRVFEAVEVRSFTEHQVVLGKPVVLKDAWLARTGHTEGDVLQQVFKQLEEVSKTLDIQSPLRSFGYQTTDRHVQDKLVSVLTSKSWGHYFLTVEAECWSQTTKKRPMSATRVHDVFEAPAPVVVPASQPLSHPSREYANITPDAGIIPGRVGAVPPRHQEFEGKRQYRAVFKELCTPIHQLEDMQTACTVMLDCLLAVELLFLAGWVHRDISSGNLLRYTGDASHPRGILADLEYAKCIQGPGDDTIRRSGDPKTGTLAFMPVEFLDGCPLRLDEEEDLDSLDSDASANEDMNHNPSGSPQVLKGALGSKSDRSILEHVYSHELESFLWLILWFIVCRILLSKGHQVPSKDRLLSIFDDRGERRKALTLKDYLKDLLLNYLPDSLSEVVNTINRFRLAVRNNHIQRLETSGQAHYAPLYSKARTCFEKCREWSKHHNVRLTPLSALGGAKPDEGGDLSAEHAKDLADDSQHAGQILGMKRSLGSASGSEPEPKKSRKV